MKSFIAIGIDGENTIYNIWGEIEAKDAPEAAKIAADQIKLGVIRNLGLEIHIREISVKTRKFNVSYDNGFVKVEEEA